MKAMVLPAFGAPLVLRDVPMPAIGPAEALLRVRTAGVGLTIVMMIGSRPREVWGEDPTFPVDPQRLLYGALEIHGSRYVTLAEIAQTLELLRHRRIRAVVTRTFPLEGAEDAHQVVRQNALVGRAALLVA